MPSSARTASRARWRRGEHGVDIDAVAQRPRRVGATAPASSPEPRPTPRPSDRRGGPSTRWHRGSADCGSTRRCAPWSRHVGGRGGAACGRQGGRPRRRAASASERRRRVRHAAARAGGLAHRRSHELRASRQVASTPRSLERRRPRRPSTAGGTRRGRRKRRLVVPGARYEQLLGAAVAQALDEPQDPGPSGAGRCGRCGVARGHVHGARSIARRLGRPRRRLRPDGDGAIVQTRSWSTGSRKTGSWNRCRERRAQPQSRRRRGRYASRSDATADRQPAARRSWRRVVAVPAPGRTGRPSRTVRAGPAASRTSRTTTPHRRSRARQPCRRGRSRRHRCRRRWTSAPRHRPARPSRACTRRRGFEGFVAAAALAGLAAVAAMAIGNAADNVVLVRVLICGCAIALAFALARYVQDRHPEEPWIGELHRVGNDREDRRDIPSVSGVPRQ